MAPEQIERRSVDGRADIFAFGAVVYEMSQGRKAFTGGTPAEVMRAIATGEPPAMPPPLGEIVGRCLAKAPGDRWHSAADLARELERIRNPRRTGSPRFARAMLAAALSGALVGAGDSSPALRRLAQFRYDTRLEVIHAFAGTEYDRPQPESLIRARDGTFYGVTATGGHAKAGSVFSLQPPARAGAAWNFQTLYSFSGGSDGADPVGGLTVGKHGELLGTASYGGRERKRHGLRAHPASRERQAVEFARAASLQPAKRRWGVSNRNYDFRPKG